MDRSQDAIIKSIVNARTLPRSVTNTRWIARIWGILAIVLILLAFFSPDPGSTEPIAAVDIFILSLTGVALLGLLMAWRWELVGGMFTIAMLFISEMVWLILKDRWMAGFLILWALIAPPAILFLLAWRMERNARK